VSRPLGARWPPDPLRGAWSFGKRAMARSSSLPTSQPTGTTVPGCARPAIVVRTRTGGSYLIPKPDTPAARTHPEPATRPTSHCDPGHAFASISITKAAGGACCVLGTSTNTREPTGTSIRASRMDPCPTGAAIGPLPVSSPADQVVWEVLPSQLLIA